MFDTLTGFKIILTIAAIYLLYNEGVFPRKGKIRVTQSFYGMDSEASRYFSKKDDPIWYYIIYSALIIFLIIGLIKLWN